MKRKDLSTVLIRRADMDEAESIASVLYRAFAEFEPLYTSAAFAATSPTPDQIRKRWSEGPVWVMEEGSQLRGTVAAVPKHEGLYIRSMAVLPSHRSRKMGYMLLQAVKHFAKMQDIRRIFLSTTPFLAGAIRLYEQFGLQRTEEGPYELFGTPLFTMAMLLEPADPLHLNKNNVPVEKAKADEK